MVFSFILAALLLITFFGYLLWFMRTEADWPIAILLAALVPVTLLIALGLVPTATAAGAAASPALVPLVSSVAAVTDYTAF